MTKTLNGAEIEFKKETALLGERADRKIQFFKDEIERLKAYIETIKCDHKYEPVEYSQVYAVETGPSIYRYRQRTAYRMECSKCGMAGKELTDEEYTKKKETK